MFTREKLHTPSFNPMFRSEWLGFFRVIALVAIVFVVAPSSPVVAEDADQSVASIGIRIVDAPPELSRDPRAGLYIIDHVAPGTSFERRLEVSTTAKSPMPVDLYAAAATIEDGTFEGARDRTLNNVSTWISVTPASIDIPAEGVATAVVSINVPSDAAPGEKYAVVWVETRSTTGGEGELGLTSRVGIRVYLSVGPGGPPVADFVIESLNAERSSSGAPVVTATVRNTGGRALDLSGTLTLRNGPGGLKAGPFPAQLGVTLGIGETAPVRVDLNPRLPSGPWDAELTLASGLNERTIFDAITFPGSSQSSSDEGERTMPAWILPVVGVFVAFLLAWIVGLGWVVFRRRRKA